MTRIGCGMPFNKRLSAIRVGSWEGGEPPVPKLRAGGRVCGSSASRVAVTAARIQRVESGASGRAFPCGAWKRVTWSAEARLSPPLSAGASLESMKAVAVR